MRRHSRHGRVHVARAGQGQARSTSAPTSGPSASSSMRCSPAAGCSRGDVHDRGACGGGKGLDPTGPAATGNTAGCPASCCERCLEKDRTKAASRHWRRASRTGVGQYHRADVAIEGESPRRPDLVSRRRDRPDCRNRRARHALVVRARFRDEHGVRPHAPRGLSKSVASEKFAVPRHR